MLALQISSMKIFMNQLLQTDAFDMFLLEEASLTAAVTYRIDGRINREFFKEEVPGSQSSPEPSWDFVPWADMRGLLFELIRGKRAPLSFKFVLHLKPESAAKVLEQAGDALAQQVEALVLTVRYENGRAQLTGGVSYRTFVMSQEAGTLWDRALSAYLSRKGIPFENL